MMIHSETLAVFHSGMWDKERVSVYLDYEPGSGDENGTFTVTTKGDDGPETQIFDDGEEAKEAYRKQVAGVLLGWDGFDEIEPKTLMEDRIEACSQAAIPEGEWTNPGTIRVLREAYKKAAWDMVHMLLPL